MSHNTHCLNCGKDLHDNYCGNCGQSAATHRFSLKHIFTHDMVHNLLHVDKGILYTVKELFTRPGHMVREYIEGKRIQQFNYITLLLVLIATQLFITHSFHYDPGKIVDIAAAKKTINKIQTLKDNNIKLLYLFLIPLTSVFSYFIFRRSGKNYAEHIVLNTYHACAQLVLGIGVIIIILLTPNHTAILVINFLSVILIQGYSLWYYPQFFRPFYDSGVSVVVRTIILLLLPVLFTFGIGWIYILIVGKENATLLIQHFISGS